MTRLGSGDTSSVTPGVLRAPGNSELNWETRRGAWTMWFANPCFLPAPSCVPLSEPGERGGERGAPSPPKAHAPASEVRERYFSAPPGGAPPDPEGCVLGSERTGWTGLTQGKRAESLMVTGALPCGRRASWSCRSPAPHWGGLAPAPT